MERETLYERLAKLMQKSRKALRLYSSMGKIQPEGSSAHAESQVAEWRAVTAELVRQLSLVLERPNAKIMAQQSVGIRDYFHNLWRMSEAQLAQQQRALIGAAEQGDFTKAAALSQELVILKARTEAAHAAHHEFSEVIRKMRIPERTIELSHDKIIAEDPAHGGALVSDGNERQGVVRDVSLAKVIPLRRAGSGR